MQQQTLSSFLVLKAPAAAAPTNLSKGASKLKKKTPETIKRGSKKHKSQVDNNEKDKSMSQSDGDDSLDSVTETESLRNFVHDDLDENEDNSGMEQRAIEHAGAFQSNTNGKKGLVLTPLTMRKKKEKGLSKEK